MANLSYGSKGSGVKKLQEELNKQGYKLDVDGIYGNKTQSAVKDYQSKNGLSVDGIAGVQTTGALYKAPANVVTPQATQAATQAARPTYTESQGYKDAQSAVTAHEQTKPQEYKGNYREQIDALLDQVLNKKKFEYDVNSDALYKQYKDQYTKLGKQAMQDTQGQAAALTGGYGSSYGVTAGSQAYQAYLDKLNNVVPELHEAAYNKYIQSLQMDKDNLGLLTNLDDRDYSKYRDSISDYYNQLQYLTGREDTEYNKDWSKYQFDNSVYDSDRSHDFSKEQFDYQKTQDTLAQSNWEKQYALSKAAASKSSSSGGSSGGSSKTSDKTSSGYSDSEMRTMIKNDNIKPVLEQLEKDYGDDTEAILNKLTTLDVPREDALALLEEHWGGSSSNGEKSLPNILTAQEFKLRPQTKQQYGSYENYVKEMRKIYG